MVFFQVQLLLLSSLLGFAAAGPVQLNSEDIAARSVRHFLGRQGTGSQFITGPCSSDADCASGCCGFNTGKCAGAIIALQRDGGCGFGATPNDNAARLLGFTGGITSKSTGLQGGTSGSGSANNSAGSSSNGGESTTSASESKASTTASTASAAAASTTSSGSFQAANGKQAQQENAKFATLTEDSDCTDGEVACINDEFAKCANGQFVLFPCGATLVCRSLPLVNSAGTSVTCDTAADAEARIQTALDS